MGSVKAALSNGSGLYIIGAIAGLALGMAIGDPFSASVFSAAIVVWLASLVIPARLRPWPLLMGTLPAIPLSFLYLLFGFPLFLPVMALLILGALRSFPQEFSLGRTQAP